MSLFSPQSAVSAGVQPPATFPVGGVWGGGSSQPVPGKGWSLQLTPGKVPKRLALRASPSLSPPPSARAPPHPHPPPRAQELIERLQGIATRPHRLRPAQSSKVRGRRAGGGRGLRGLEAASRLVPLTRSPATTAPSSHAAWSHCFCWGRAGRREPGAAPTREQQGPGQSVGGAGEVGTGALCPSRLAEPPRQQHHAGERVCPPGSRGRGPQT